MTRNVRTEGSDGGSAPLAQKAYDALRRAIECGKFAPGVRISEYQIADWLSISRTPVREALQRLEAEGLLSSRTRRGLAVVSVDEDALKELFRAREFLESALAEEAALNASGPELAAILRHSAAEAELLGNHERMYEHNKEFHALIRRAAHNRFLAKSSVSVSDIVAADRRGSSLLDPDRQASVLAEHARLARAISERDGRAAARAAAEHVRGAYHARLNMTPSLQNATRTALPGLKRRS